MDLVTSNFLPGDPRLIDQIVYELKSQGIFDQFRKECIADVDTKPAYQNLSQRVEGSVMNFLKKQKFTEDVNKNQLREQLRKNITESGFLESGVERIVDQVVNPKINSVFLPKVEDVVYRFLGITRPTHEGQPQEEKLETEDLLPKDLEAVSPESVHEQCDHDSPKKREEDEDEANESFNSSTAKTDDESPEFEPLEENPTFSVQEDNSVDSQVSASLVIASNDTAQNTEILKPEIEKNEEISQTSINSSSEDNSKMDICDNNTTMSENSDKLEIAFENPVNETHKKSDDSNSQKEKTDDKKNDENKKAHDRHRKSSRSDKHRKEDRDNKDHAKSKDRKERSSSKHSFSKDKDKKSYTYSSRDDVSEKERLKKDEKYKHSSRSKENKEKSLEKRDRSKERSDKDKSRDKSQREKYEQEKSKSSKEKDRSRFEKDKYDKDRSKSSKHHRDRSSSLKSSKIKDSKHDNDKKGDFRPKIDEKKDRSSSQHKSSSKSDKDRKITDDHYSFKDKKSERRSTDRDSNDESSKMSRNNSFTESSSNSQKESGKDSSENLSSGAGDSSNSDNVEKNSSSNNKDSDLKQPHVKCIKPKFASNIHEAMKIMKIRKQLAKLERLNQLALANHPVANEDNNDSSSIKKVTANDKLTASSLSSDLKNMLELQVKLVKHEGSEEENLAELKGQDLSTETFEALEARLAQEMSHVNDQVYGDEDEESYEYSTLGSTSIEKQPCSVAKTLIEETDVTSENKVDQSFNGARKLIKTAEGMRNNGQTLNFDNLSDSVNTEDIVQECTFFTKADNDKNEFRLAFLDKEIVKLENYIKDQSLKIQNNIPTPKKASKRKHYKMENNNSFEDQYKPVVKKKILNEPELEQVNDACKTSKLHFHFPFHFHMHDMF
ncbi:hypothetical protein ABEB36_009134 [Hypothenemus hampei]|uniref:BOD1/SHG1 domain-containing protein n=1 Tax=Hypothenemus hampei TaxID=57062 RepID=A0ABD1EP99_HYPHA